MCLIMSDNTRKLKVLYNTWYIPHYLYKIQNILNTQTYLVLRVSHRDYGFIVLFNKMSFINKMPTSLLKVKIT